MAEQFVLQQAQRKKAKMRLGITAPSGAGKTYSALLLARGIASDWSKIALIDTENGSGSLYSDLGGYQVITLTAPFSPERYIGAIEACEKAGMEVIVIDSVSHEWDGEGGCLEIQEKLGGRYQDWAQVTPRHKKFLGAILQSTCHIITTARRKQDYSMVTEGSKTKVQKVGLKEVQREGFEYELTVNFEVAADSHLARASKDRTGMFADRPAFIITEETGLEILKWCESGAVDVEAEEKSKTIASIRQILTEIGAQEQWLIDAYAQGTPLNSLTLTAVKKLEKGLTDLVARRKAAQAEKEKRDATPTPPAAPAAPVDTVSDAPMQDPTAPVDTVSQAAEMLGGEVVPTPAAPTQLRHDMNCPTYQGGMCGNGCVPVVV